MNMETTEQLRARAKRVLDSAGHGSRTALAREAGVTTATVRRFLKGTVDTDEETLPRLREGLEKLEAKVGKEDLESSAGRSPISSDEFNQMIAGFPARLVAASETLNSNREIEDKVDCLVDIYKELRKTVDKLLTLVKRP